MISMHLPLAVALQLLTLGGRGTGRAAHDLKPGGDGEADATAGVELEAAGDERVAFDGITCPRAADDGY